MLLRLLVLLVLALSATVGEAIAQTPAAFPARPAHFIVPFPPGQATDILARLVADSLTGTWGQQGCVAGQHTCNRISTVRGGFDRLRGESLRQWLARSPKLRG